MKSKTLNEIRGNWSDTSSGTENTLQQLAPYIGKMKTSLARSLVENFTKPGDTVIDPFCGSGVICLEALTLGRNVVANDLNPYASILTRAKLNPIDTVEEACKAAESVVEEAKSIALDANYNVDAPEWVRAFFHHQT